MLNPKKPYSSDKLSLRERQVTAITILQEVSRDVVVQEGAPQNLVKLAEVLQLVVSRVVLQRRT